MSFRPSEPADCMARGRRNGRTASCGKAKGLVPDGARERAGPTEIHVPEIDLKVISSSGCLSRCQCTRTSAWHWSLRGQSNAGNLPTQVEQ
jgi:hypothetical protein